jgi:HK97 gp10 family phage protein
MPESLKWFGDAFMKQLAEEMPDALFEGAEMLVNEARGKINNVSGNLAESGYAATANKSTYRKDKRNLKELKPKEGQAVAAFPMFYAGFVEYGTSNSPARPFLRPTLDQLKEQIGDAIALKMAKAFK